MTRQAHSDAAAPGRAESLPSPYEDAEFYDLIFREFADDLGLYRRLAKQVRGPVLEVGCGTGRVTIPCLKDGADVDGLDLEPNMLRTLERKAAALGLEARTYAADMRDFTLPRRYALILVTFNAFLHNLSTEDQLRTLRCCLAHLEPGGELVMHVSFFSAAIVGELGGEPVLEMETRDPETGHVLQLYDTRRFDQVRQLQHSLNEVRELDADGRVVSSRVSETRVRWIYAPEMELLLEKAGFARWEIRGGFDLRPLESEQDQMIVRAWKA